MRSILLHIYDDVALESRLQAALDVARVFNGHVTALHTAPFEDYLAADPLMAAALPEEFSSKMRRVHEALRGRIVSRLEVEDISWDWVRRDEAIVDALVRYSALSDIIVVSRADAALFRDEPRPIAGPVAISAACPVLVVPERQRSLDLEKPVMVAWNGSAEAAAAVRGALPILRRASWVHLVEVEENSPAYPRDAVARYLSRHDIHVEIVERTGRRDIADSLIATASELDAGLVVLGAYGRSRLREWVFGGVTRDLLAATELPLLLAH